MVFLIFLSFNLPFYSIRVIQIYFIIMAALEHKTVESSLKEITALPVSWFVKRLEDQTLYMLDMKNSDVHSISAQVKIYTSGIF